jgi:hypothetical protein
MFRSGTMLEATNSSKSREMSTPAFGEVGASLFFCIAVAEPGRSKASL